MVPVLIYQKATIAIVFEQKSSNTKISIKLNYQAKIKTNKKATITIVLQ